MSVKVADVHADIGARTAPSFQGAIGSAQGALAGLAKVAAVAAAGITAGFAGRALHAVEEQETAARRLRGALAASGQEVNANAAGFTAFAAQVSKGTDFTKAQAQASLALAVDMGAPASEATKIVAKAAALAQAYGKDLAGVTGALTEFYKGNTNALDGTIGSLNTASSAAAKKLRVDAAVSAAAKQMSAETGGLSRQLKIAGESFDRVAATIAQAVLPTITTLIQGVDSLINGTDGLSKAQREAFVRAIDFGIGLAAIVVVGPTVVSALVGMAKGAYALSVGMKAVGLAKSLVTGGAVALLAAGAAVATAFAFDINPIKEAEKLTVKLGSAIRKEIGDAANAVVEPIKKAGEATRAEEAKSAAAVQQRVNTEIAGIQQIAKAREFLNAEDLYRRKVEEAAVGSQFADAAGAFAKDRGGAAGQAGQIAEAGRETTATAVAATAKKVSDSVREEFAQLGALSELQDEQIGRSPAAAGPGGPAAWFADAVESVRRAAATAQLDSQRIATGADKGGTVDINSKQLGDLTKLQQQSLTALQTIARKNSGPGQ